MRCQKAFIRPTGAIVLKYYNKKAKHNKQGHNVWSGVKATSFYLSNPQFTIMVIEYLPAISNFFLCVALSIAAYFVALFTKESDTNFNNTSLLTFFFVWFAFGIMVDWTDTVPSFIVFFGMLAGLGVLFFYMIFLMPLYEFIKQKKWFAWVVGLLKKKR